MNLVTVFHSMHWNLNNFGEKFVVLFLLLPHSIAELLTDVMLMLLDITNDSHEHTFYYLT